MVFLETVASSLYNIHRDHLHRLAVVFPNRRQSIFFRHYFMQIADPPAFVPQLLTIEQMVQQSALHPVADPLLQSFELYQAYKSICMEDGEDPGKIPDYEQFYPIGDTLIKDFREIDAYLLDIKEVCSILYNIESIEKAFEQLTEEQKGFLKQFWSSITDKGFAQERFLKLWRRLPAIYQLFHQQLQQKGYTTLGMAYRQLAGGNPSTANFNAGWDHVAFVGFNAFNKAEEIVIQRWQEKEYASFWFDTDEYYLNDAKQEAGFFLRKTILKLEIKNQLPALNNIAAHTKPIIVSKVKGHTAQAKIISTWMEQFRNGEEIGTSAILLADESLLQPVLQSLPEDSTAVNVTMGYPLQQTAVYSFFNLYFNIHTDLAKHRWQSLNYTLVEEWLNHPFNDWTEDLKTKLSEKIISQVLVDVPLKALQKKSPVTNLLLLRMNAEADVFSRLRQMLQLVQQQPGLREDALIQGAILGAWQMLQVAEPLFSQLKPTPALYLIEQVLRRHLSSITIPFEGEPLKGIQVMGLLESRGLDFKHILVLGAAEGTLPGISAPPSFLPYAIRKAFGLPVPEYQDSIFAYTFYRLLHRSTSMQLVYNGLVSDNSTGEPSRFIQQLRFETSIPFIFKEPGLMVKPTAPPPISVEKTPEIRKRLSKYLLQEPASFSPSQINTYLACRLQYFFKYLANLKKPDQLTEEIDAATLGSIVHGMMEQLYKDVLAKQGNWMINKESIQWMRDRKESIVEEAFRKVRSKNNSDAPLEFNGMLEVMKQVVLQYVDGFLTIDENYAPFTVQDVEVNMLQPFAIELEGKPVRLMMNGKIDRLDQKDGVFRMVDFKTGGDKTGFSGVELLFERDGKKQNKAALQTLIYSWLFQKQFPQHASFEPALIPFREFMNSRESASTQLVINKSIPVTAANIHEYLPEVETSLRKLLQEVFDENVPFDQTTNEKVCEYCDFKGICFGTR
jgi:hypothetical protein